jgi:hypothetical protein
MVAKNPTGPNRAGVPADEPRVAARLRTRPNLWNSAVAPLLYPSRTDQTLIPISLGYRFRSRTRARLTTILVTSIPHPPPIRFPRLHFCLVPMTHHYDLNLNLLTSFPCNALMRSIIPCDFLSVWYLQFPTAF